MKKLLKSCFILSLGLASSVHAQGILDKVDRLADKVDRTTYTVDRATNTAERANSTGGKLFNIFKKKKKTRQIDESDTVEIVERRADAPKSKVRKTKKRR